MRALKGCLVFLGGLLLVSALALLILLKWPTEIPDQPPSIFAPRPSAVGGRHTSKGVPIGIEVLSTGASRTLEAFTAQGGSLFKTRRFVYPAIVISHPKGKFLFDGGLGSQFPQERSEISLLFRLLNPFQLEKPLKAWLTPEERPIDFALVSHVHWDHLSGLLDLPEVPIRMLAAEREFATGQKNPKLHGILPEQMKHLKNRIQPIELKDGPYENFPRSLDLFRDGRIVLVALPGHTPGSLGVFVNLDAARRYLLVGDAIYSVDEKGRPEARPFATELFSDHDRVQARMTRKKLEELIGHSNEITLIPSHDPRALAKLPSP